MKRYLLVGVAVAGAILLAGCGSATVNSSPVASTTAAAKAAPVTKATVKAAPKTTAPPAVAHVGSTVAVKGDNEDLNVQLAALMDPAPGSDEFTTPDPGKRFIGVKLVIADVGSKAVQDDANNDVSVVGSDNQTYSPDFADLAGCTNFNSGTFTLAPGATSTGCVTFDLPSTVKVVKVAFSPPFSGNVSEWLVP